MKALSLKQPWAWAVIEGIKDIENRKWKTKFRGDLLIHASRTFDGIGFIVLQNMGLNPPPESFLERGSIIGRVTVIDCVRVHPSRFFFGPWGFILRDPIKFKEPIFWKGQLGIFEIPDEVVRRSNGEG